MISFDREDALVRAALQDLKRDDARTSPPFDTVLTRAYPRRARLHSSPVLRLAAAGVVIAAASVTYQAVQPRDIPFHVPPEAAALAAWRPATDVLMPAPATLVGADVTLGGSILNFSSPARGQIP